MPEKMSSSKIRNDDRGLLAYDEPGNKAEIEDVLLKAFSGHDRVDIQVLDRKVKGLKERYGDQVYSSIFYLTFHQDFTPSRAKTLWQGLLHHHEIFEKTLGNKVDFRVSGLDYLLRQTKTLRNPTVVEFQKYLGVHQDTVTDELTGLFNFRYLRRVLDRELKVAKRYSAKCALLFLDLDHFKQINDRYGHLVGDEVLRKVADVISHSVRSSDLPCRYGGEEFAVIAPHTDRKGAKLLAERIRSGISKIEVSATDGSKQTLSISGGVACFPQDAGDPEELLRIADKALYLAKSKGRNRVEFYQEEKRQSPRFSVALPVQISFSTDHRERTSTRNLSESGLLLELSAPLELGNTIQLELALENTSEPVQLVGSVTHLSRGKNPGSFEVGISIVRMSKTDRTKYRRFIETQTAVA